MASSGSLSGTYLFQPALGELIIAAYRRIGIHRSEILTEHMADGHMEANLMQVQWANLGPVFWNVELTTVSLINGTAVYSVPADTVMVLDLYISNVSSNGTVTDTIVSPIRRTAYASQPLKAQTGSPQQYWYDRLVNPTITFWPVPDGTDASFSYYSFVQMQDATTANAGQANIVYLCLDAFVAGLAYRLSVIYPPANSKTDYGDMALKAFNVVKPELLGVQRALGTEGGDK